jgi:hypothetical protein
MARKNSESYLISFRQWESWHIASTNKEGTARILANALTGIDAVHGIQVQTKDGRLIPFHKLEPFS